MKGRPEQYSAAEMEELYLKHGFQPFQIAEKLGCSTATVANKLRELQQRKNKPLTAAEQIQAIIDSEVDAIQTDMQRWAKRIADLQQLTKVPNLHLINNNLKAIQGHVAKLRRSP